VKHIYRATALTIAEARPLVGRLIVQDRQRRLLASLLSRLHARWGPQTVCHRPATLGYCGRVE
jgi:hypothetical protein